MLGLLGTRDCPGNSMVTGKGQREPLACQMRGDHVRDTRAGVAHSDTDAFPQVKEWITPVLGTGSASTAGHHLLDLGLAPRCGDHCKSPVQLGWRQ